MAVRVLTGLLQVGLGLLMVWLCKQFIDDTIHYGDNHDILVMVALLVATVVMGIILRQCYYYMTILARTKQSNNIRLRIFSLLMKQRLYDSQKMHSGDLVSRLERDIDQVSETVVSMIPELIVTGSKLIGAFLLLRWMDTCLAWMLLLLTPVFILLGKTMARKLRLMTHDIRKQESRIQMTIQEGLEHNAVIRALESNAWIAGQVDGMQHGLREKITRRTRFTVIARTLMAASFGLGYLLAFVWGGLQLRNGIITIGVMTSFLQLVGQVQQPILGLLNMAPQLIHTTASIDRLEELETLETENETQADTGDDSCYGIRFDNVTFKYADGDNNVMENFTHDFKPNTCTAIMGHTGAGKTTIFRMILGMIQPQSGRLTMYGDMTDGDVVSPATRKHIVFVPQGNTLMSGTIRYNLLLAKPSATDKELHQVLHTAMADFVEQLPEGIDTEIGERGSGLSEGQAQRIAIARGLLRPGSIMLLDEISSALDEDTEKELFVRLFAKCREKTIIMITHRLGVARLCDDVVTMNASA